MEPVFVIKSSGCKQLFDETILKDALLLLSSRSECNLLDHLNIQNESSESFTSTKDDTDFSISNIGNLHQCDISKSFLQNKFYTDSPLLRTFLKALNNIDIDLILSRIVDSICSNITTTELNNLVCDVLASLSSVHYEYSYLAGRYFIYNFHKQSSFGNFSDKMKILHQNNVVSDSFYKKVLDFQGVFDFVVDYKRDYFINYFGMKTLMKSYLLSLEIDMNKLNCIKKEVHENKLNNGVNQDRNDLKTNQNNIKSNTNKNEVNPIDTVKGSSKSSLTRIIIERPQDLFMRVSIGIHDNIEDILLTYYLLSNKYFTHATPTLFNAGTIKPQMSSCFLLDMKSDSIDGIYSTLKDCAFISKNSGGIGLSITKIRASDSLISFSGTSNGIVPMLRVFDQTARYVDQGGNKRPGTIAVFLETWHLDVFDFVELRKNTGKEELRTRDLFLGLWVNDLFMERVELDGDWSLFCPNECYFMVKEKIEPRNPKDLINGSKHKYIHSNDNSVNANENFKNDSKSMSDSILIDSLSEFGIAIDNSELINKYEMIVQGRQSPEEVLNKIGHVFKSLEDLVKYLKMINQNEFENDLENIDQNICKKLSKDNITYSHNQKNNNSQKTVANDFHPYENPFVYVLKNKKLSKYKKTPLYDLYSAEFKIAYEYLEKNLQKKKVVKAQHLWKHIIEAQIETGTPYMLYKDACNERNNQKNLGTLKGSNLCTEILQYTGFDEIAVCNLGSIALPAFIKEYVDNKMDDFGSLIYNFNQSTHDPDLLSTNSNSRVLDINSSHSDYSSLLNSNDGSRKCSFDFQNDKRTISGNCEITSDECSINKESSNAISKKRRCSRKEDNDIKDELEPFKKEIEINNHHELNKARTESVCNCFDFDIQNISSTKFIQTLNNQKSTIEPENYYTKNNKKLYFDYNSLILISKKLCKNLNSVINKNYYPIFEAQNSNKKHRPIGIGVQGLADVFFRLGVEFESEEAKKINKRIFECIYYGAMSESIKLAKINGAYESFIGSPLEKGILQFDYYAHKNDKLNQSIENMVKDFDRNSILYEDILDSYLNLNWNSLRKGLKNYGAHNSLLLAPMPTASTSQILGYNECIEPQTSNIYTRRTLAGEFQIINKYLIKDLMKKNMWDNNMKNYLVENEGSIQRLKISFNEPSEKDTIRKSTNQNGNLNNNLNQNDNTNNNSNQNDNLNNNLNQNDNLNNNLTQNGNLNNNFNNNSNQNANLNNNLNNDLNNNSIGNNLNNNSSEDKNFNYSKESKSKVSQLPQRSSLDLTSLYKNVWEMKMKNIIDMASDRQMFIDQSQSLNLFIAEPSYSKISSMHFYAWKKGLKTGMYYLRTKPKAAAIKFTVDKDLLKIFNEGEVCEMKDGCLSCSG